MHLGLIGTTRLKQAQSIVDYLKKLEAGTPTVIIVGRNSRPVDGWIRAVMGKRGEPGRPSNPAEGVVWAAISAGHSRVGLENEWVSVEEVPRVRLATHPWSLSGGGASIVTEKINGAPVKLRDRIGAIGYSSITGDDEFLVSVGGHAKRLNADVVRYVIGEEIRDYRYRSDFVSLVPQARSGEPREPGPELMRHLWRGKTILANRLYIITHGEFKDRMRQRAVDLIDAAPDAAMQF